MTRGEGTGALRRLPALTLFFMLGPVVAGFWGTLGPAFGLMETVGGSALSLDPMLELTRWPGFAASVRLSLVTGLLAAVLSLLSVTAIAACWQGTRTFRAIERALSPLLSVPHAAAAFGIAFLIAPSGWIARLFSPWLSGWERPPDLLIVQDPAGLAMVAGLVAKEVPFLMLMTIAALGQSNPAQARMVTASLGYGRATGWLKTVFPAVYAQIRLPVYVVVAYSMSVVDVAMILGPNTPAPLSVQIVRWMGDPDLTMRLRAAAGALVQLGLVIGALVLWRGGELVAARIGQCWIWAGGRGAGRTQWIMKAVSASLAAFVALAVMLGLGGLGVWSLAGFWTFPDLLPDQITLRSWQRHADALAGPILETAIIALAATLAALVLTVGCLEAEYRHGLRLTRRGLWLLYTPLLIPQVAFLPGLQILMLNTGVSSGRVAVIFAHLVFVLPYVFLSLSAPFRAWDTRMGTVARTLGAGPGRVLWTVRLPMLLGPVLTAAAVGLSVSVGQYLPTLLVGGGRVQTLTTEALALASGGDRRAIGVFGIVQTLAALLPFALAIAVPRLTWRSRRGLQHG